MVSIFRHDEFEEVGVFNLYVMSFSRIIFVVVRVGDKLNRGSDKFYTMTLKPMER